MLLSGCSEASAAARQSFYQGIVGDGASAAQKILGKTYKNLAKSGAGAATLEGVATLIQAVEAQVSAAAAASSAATAATASATAAAATPGGGGGGGAMAGDMEAAAAAAAEIGEIKIDDELVQHYSSLLESAGVQEVDMGCDTVDAIRSVCEKETPFVRRSF
eukprot:COSAG06_NODE_4283_length_4403_cov_8.272368_8_plen_162_part_00